MNGSCVLEDLDDREVFTEEFWDLDQEGLDDFTQLILHIIVFVTGVPLNSWIIVKLVKKKLYYQPTYLLLLNLAVTDLLICLIPVLLNIIYESSRSYSFGGSDYVRCQVCKIAIIYIILNYQTIFNLTLISLDRFAFFKLSIRYHRIVRTGRVGVALIVIWVFSVLLSIPPLAGYGDIVLSAGCGMIFATSVHARRSIPYISIGFAVHTVGITILIVTNIWILYIGLKQVRSLRVKPAPKTEGNYFERRLSIIDVDSTVKQVKLFQVFGGILLVHFVTLIPALVLVVIVVVSNNIPPAFYRFVLFSLFAAAPLHPLVEAFFTPELKKVFKKWCKVCRKKRRPSESSGYYLY